MKNLVNKPQKSRERSSYLKRFIGIIFACLLMQNSSAQIIFPVSLSIIEFASVQADTSKLYIPTESIYLFASQGSKAYVTITTGKSWCLRCSEKWLSADVQSGTGVRKIEIKADENIGTGARSAYVTIYVKGFLP